MGVPADEDGVEMTAELPVALAIIGLVVLASALQRITGVGFAMMMAPFLVVMIGPHGGVMLSALLSVVAPLLVMPLVWRVQDFWKKRPRLLFVQEYFHHVEHLFGGD